MKNNFTGRSDDEFTLIFSVVAGVRNFYPIIEYFKSSDIKLPVQPLWIPENGLGN